MAWTAECETASSPAIRVASSNKSSTRANDPLNCVHLENFCECLACLVGCFELPKLNSSIRRDNLRQPIVGQERPLVLHTGSFWQICALADRS